MAHLGLTPAFAAGLERSGKPVRQHALVRGILPRLKHCSHPISRCFNIKQVYLIYFIFMNDNCESCWIFEAHLANAKCPKHGFQKVFITYSFVAFYSCDSRSEYWC